jgi:TetR/AcrR family transcriptional regulator of autoinduction and epiphytic fitness
MGRPGPNAPPKDGQLIDAAMALFLERGVGRTSVDLICKSVGISKATFYRHFDDKDHILQALVRRQVQKTNLIPVGINASSAAPEPVLIGFAQKMLAVLDQRTTSRFYQMMIAESLHSPELGQMFFTSITQAGLVSLQHYLAEQTEKAILAIPNPELAAFQFMGMFKEALFWPRLFGLNAEQIHLDREQVITSAVALFLNQYQTR